MLFFLDAFDFEYFQLTTPVAITIPFNSHKVVKPLSEKEKPERFALLSPNIAKILCNSKQFVPNFSTNSPFRPYKQDIYEMFIEQHKSKKYPSGTRLEKHHILPRFQKGTDDPDNILSLSIKDHTLAHFYRYLAYSQRGDKVAYTMRQNQTEDTARNRSMLAVEANKADKKLFWDPDWQSLQGTKGGKVAGKKNTLAQQQARSQVGKIYGPKVGISNQSTKLKALLQNTITWRHRSGKIVTTNPSESFQAICNVLNSNIPGEIRNSSSFRKVLDGQRKQMYNWEILSMAIRSEAANGL